MQSKHELLTLVYEKFNAREIDAVLARMDPHVDWPNGMEGGRVHGRDGLREYWLRQWSLLDPRVVPTRLTDDEKGRTVVDVHQVVRDLSGKILVDQMVQHIYTIQDGLIRRMDICEVEPSKVQK